MNKTAFALIAAAALAIQAGAETKIATIDIEHIVDLHPDTQRNRKLLRDTAKNYQKDIDALESTALAARKAASAAIEDSLNQAYSDKKRKEAEEEAQKKIEIADAAQRDYEKKRRELHGNLNEQGERMLQLTIREIQGKVAEYAKANGFTAVLPTSGRRLGIAPAIWFDNSIDITAEIMATMNIKEPEETKEEEESKSRTTVKVKDILVPLSQQQTISEYTQQLINAIKEEVDTWARTRPDIVQAIEKKHGTVTVDAVDLRSLDVRTYDNSGFVRNDLGNVGSVEFVIRFWWDGIFHQDGHTDVEFVLVPKGDEVEFRKCSVIDTDALINLDDPAFWAEVGAMLLL